MQNARQCVLSDGRDRHSYFVADGRLRGAARAQTEKNIHRIPALRRCTRANYPARQVGGAQTLRLLSAVILIARRVHPRVDRRFIDECTLLLHSRSLLPAAPESYVASAESAAPSYANVAAHEAGGYHCSMQRRLGRCPCENALDQHGNSDREITA